MRAVSRIALRFDIVVNLNQPTGLDGPCKPRSLYSPHSVFGMDIDSDALM